MREMKFRYVIKDEEGKELYITDPYDVYLTLEGELYTVDHDKLNAKLIQFTGLYDRNGKEIYEGDILSFYDLRNSDLPLKTGHVEYKNGSFVIYSEYSSHYRWIDYVNEKIGNIYENIELLTEEN